MKTFLTTAILFGAGLYIAYAIRTAYLQLKDNGDL